MRELRNHPEVRTGEVTVGAVGGTAAELVGTLNIMYGDIGALDDANIFVNGQGGGGGGDSSARPQQNGLGPDRPRVISSLAGRSLFRREHLRPGLGIVAGASVRSGPVSDRDGPTRGGRGIFFLWSTS